MSELSASDEADFLAAMQASRELYRPWIDPVLTADGFRELLARSHDPSFYSLIARRRVDAAIVGYFNISSIVRGPFQSAFMGYGAVAGYERQGHMTAALGLVLNHAFGTLRLHRIEANIQPGNTPSIALVRRCGFVKEGFSERYLKVGGRWRDHERWAIRAEQWREFSAQRPAGAHAAAPRR